jgi:Flp pilus assembly protein TadD
LLSSCASKMPPGKTTSAEGPFSAGARNQMASRNPVALLRIGEGFERSGNLASAMNIYAQAMAADPVLIEAQIAFARVSINSGARARGMAVLTTLIADHPGDDQVRGALAEAYIKEGNFKAADLFLSPILGADDISAENLNLGARIAQVTGHGARARELFERALEKAPGNPDILKNMAYSFALAGDFPTAVALLQGVMDKTAGLIPGKVALATVYALSGQLDAATMLARGAMDLDKANSRRLFYQLLPRLNADEQALAVMFEIVPKDAMQRLTGAAAK